MTNYVIGHLPYSSAGLSDDHGLNGDYTKALDQTTERGIADLVRVDERVAFKYARLCCDVGVFIRKPDGAAKNLFMVELSGRRLRDKPSDHQLAIVQALAQQHMLLLCNRIAHALVWMPTIVIDIRSIRKPPPRAVLRIIVCCAENSAYGQSYDQCAGAA